jgi:myo-inositol 2-dehydrogenase / D-chiro-inositol 1-dehydrogenase
MNSSTENHATVTRRDFVKTTAAVSAATLAGTAWGAAGAADTIRVGLIGCGGRGTGAAQNCLQASEQVKVVALGDLFSDRLQGSRQSLATNFADRATVSDDHCFVGFDAFEKVIADNVDVVILATPPHFRPQHFAAAVDAGKHVFMEKPVAVDPVGIRLMLQKAEDAKAKKLSVVAGTQRRHEKRYQVAMERIHDGAIGDIISTRCYWNMGFLWAREREQGWTDMEWQVRNWLYFAWLSGDHICEQHVHNLDVCNWAIGTHPVKALGLGGRQVRTSELHGNIFDHHAIDYEYPDGQHMLSMCRQIGGCASNVSEAIHGATGRCIFAGNPRILGKENWRFTGDNPNPYVQEHVDLIASLTGQGKYWNEAKQVAESTMTAIMGRMSTYTGQEVTWDQAMNSTLDLSPPAYEFGDLEVRPVAVPGTTPLV